VQSSAHDSLQEGARAFISRRIKNGLRRPLFDNHALIHEDHAIRNLARELDFMG